ncbi:MAG: cytochrome P450, partial [Candidatus Nanopelagicales bacterium]|nr:cytochrome P450 [Candidatus Nanopelagicales bacterium]
MQSHGEAESSSLDSSSPVSKSQAIYDPVSPEAHLDPYPIYQQLREHHPLYYVAEHDVWALSRY